MQERVAAAQRPAYLAHGGSTTTAKQPAAKQCHSDRHQRSELGASDLWFSESTGLVADGLDDGLDQPLSAHRSTARAGDNESRTSGGNSGSASSQSPIPSLEAELASGSGARNTVGTSGAAGTWDATSDNLVASGAQPVSFANRNSNIAYSPSFSDEASAIISPATVPDSALTSAAKSGSADTSFVTPLASAPVTRTPVTNTAQVGFADGLAGWNIGQLGGSAEHQGTVKEGSAILREGDSFLVTLDTDVTIPEQPLNLTFTYTASFDTSDSGSIKDAFEAALTTTAGDPLVYSFAPQRDAFFNVTEGLPSVLGRGTVERTVDTGNQVSLDISQLVPGTQAVVAFRLVNNDADEDTTIHILDVEVTSGTDAPPAVTVELANDTAPDGPGTDAYRSDLLTNDPRVSGTATDDDAITKLEVQVDNGPFTDITAALVNGQYSYDPGNLAAGSHRMTVRATDTLSQTAESIIDFVVNALPMANAGGNRTVNEGDTVTFDGSGSSDSDDALFGYLWGFHDGNSATEVASSHVYPQDGTFPVSLTVTDTAGSVSSDQIQVFVANVAATIAAVDDKQANEGDIVSLQTTFVDPGVLDTHTATIDWGDGTSPEPAQIVEQSGAGTVSSMHQYRDDGQYTVTIQVTDSDEAESSVQFDVHVDNLAPTVVTATDLNGTVGDRLDFTATFSDPGVLDTHTAIVQWGDGATSVAAVTENNGQGTVSANHAYALGGTHTIRVEVTDDAGEASDRLATATVIGGQLSSIAGYVYLDVNNNGIKDPPEKALPNVPVTLSGAVSWTVLTAADGSYRFDDLPQGTYAVTETQPLAFLDGRDTQGSLRLGTVASDQFQGLVLAADTHATDYNFGELGLRAELIGKYLYLASTPSAEELIARMMVPGERWATFQANDSGLLSVSIPLDVHSPVIEVYTGGMLPVTLSDGEHAASARVEEGATYVMYVAGQAESLPFETALQIDVSEPPGTPPTHPRYYINPVNALDTTGDGVVSPRDVLVVIDALNHGGEVNLDAGLLFLDVTGDEILSPRDVLVCH